MRTIDIFKNQIARQLEVIKVRSDFIFVETGVTKFFQSKMLLLLMLRLLLGNQLKCRVLSEHLDDCLLHNRSLEISIE